MKNEKLDIEFFQRGKMAIQQRIQKAKGYRSGCLAPIEEYTFTESELNTLLDQVEKEQREICANKYFAADEDENLDWVIRNAPSPRGRKND